MEIEFKVTVDVVGEDIPVIRDAVRMLVLCTIDEMEYEASRGNPTPFWAVRGTTVAVGMTPDCTNDLLEALRWIVDHGDTGSHGRPAYYDMRAHAQTAITKADRLRSTGV